MGFDEDGDRSSPRSKRQGSTKIIHVSCYASSESVAEYEDYLAMSHLNTGTTQLEIKLP
jgi:hypothetical protein